MHTASPTEITMSSQDQLHFSELLESAHVEHRLGFALPVECVPGVTANLEVLAEHVAHVRTSLENLENRAAEQG